MSRANFLRSLDSGRAVRYSDQPAESARPRLGAGFQGAKREADAGQGMSMRVSAAWFSAAEDGRLRPPAGRRLKW